MYYTEVKYTLQKIVIDEKNKNIKVVFLSYNACFFSKNCIEKVFKGHIRNRPRFRFREILRLFILRRKQATIHTYKVLMHCYIYILYT